MSTKLLKTLLLLVLFGIFQPTALQAKTAVLVHGYLSNGMDWRNNETTFPLIYNGWQDGGHYTPQQPYIDEKKLKNAFYTVDLPYKENIQTQTNWLSQYLQHLYNIRKEPVILIGHSAGGLVARNYLLQPQSIPVSALITIATPHIGTPVANLTYLTSKTPLGEMASMLGIDMNNSKAIYADLREEKPGTFLYWMNHQPHPDITYVSFIRSNANSKNMDIIVPPSHQNMNNVAALFGKSQVYLTNDSHFLSGKDGAYLVSVLENL